MDNPIIARLAAYCAHAPHDELAVAALAELERLYQKDYDYAEIQNVIHTLLEGIDDAWAASHEGRVAIDRALAFLAVSRGVGDEG